MSVASMHETGVDHSRLGRAQVPTWVAFALRRSLRLVVSLWVLMTASFLMIHLIPGDPVRQALGRAAPIETIELRRQELGLDLPLLTQYLHYFGDVFSGEFGTSLTSSLPVSQIIGDRLPATLQLAVGAFVLVMVLTIPIGTIMAVMTRGGRRPKTELAFASTSIVAAAIPEFLTATALVSVFAVGLGWFPVAGNADATSLVLPMVALAIGPAAVLSRILRVDLLAILGQDFIRTARAKRLRSSRVYLRHALPNACTSTLTLGGLTLGGLIAGTVLIENVFAWPGLGSAIVTAILQKDYPLVQAIVLVYGLLVLLINFAVDGVLAVLDPRSQVTGA